MKAKDILKKVETSIDNSIDKGLSSLKGSSAGRVYSTAKGEKGTKMSKRLKYGAHIGGLSTIAGLYGIASLKEGKNNKQKAVIE